MEIDVSGNELIYSEMASIVGRHAPDDHDFETKIEGLCLGRRTSPSQPIHTTQWAGFALVLQGEKSLTLNGEIYRYGVGDCLVVSLDLPVISKVTEASLAVPHLGIGMAINTERLKHVMARIGLTGAQGLREDMRGVGVVKASGDLLDAVVRLVRLLDRPQDIAAIASLIEEEIFYRLLCGPFGRRLIQIAIAETPGNRVALAIAWLKQNFMQQLRIEDLASEVGMSPSSLHHHFKAVTAMTPMQYQKHLRLHEARRLMLIERVDVGTAGYAVGYQSPSQFSREYSRLYGQSPLRDVGGLRRIAAQ